MTVMLPHPSWCDPAQCRAYADGDLEPYHRSAPVVLHVAPGEDVAVYLAQPSEYPELVSVELVALHQPYDGPVWAVDDVRAEISLPLDQAAALAQAIRQFVQAATA